MDGTLIQAWASHKSFVRRDDSGRDSGGPGDKRAGDAADTADNNNTGAEFKGQTRNMGHTLSDNRHGLIANAMVTTADGYAEREAAKVMIHATCEAASDETINITLGADKGFDAREFIEACLEMGVTPHVAQNKSARRSAVPEEIATSVGYAISQNKRKLIEQGFGWAKTVGRMRQVMVRGLKRVDQMFVLTMAAYNLTRMRTLGQIRPLAA